MIKWSLGKHQKQMDRSQILEQPGPYLSLVDPFHAVYLLQVLGLKCRQFEMDISSADPGGSSGKYTLAVRPQLCKNE